MARGGRKEYKLIIDQDKKKLAVTVIYTQFLALKYPVSNIFGKSNSVVHAYANLLSEVNKSHP